jgi:hypothetical protein
MTTAVPAPKVTNYQGNSKVAQENAAAEAEANAERVPAKKIEGVSVVKAKKPLGSRIKDSFGGQDAKSVGSFVVMEVLLPGARDILFDIVKESAHRFLYGDGARRNTNGGSSSIVGSGSRIRTTNYSTMSASPIVGSSRASNNAPSTLSQRDRNLFDFSNLIFPEQDMALEVIERLGDAIDEFGIVTVADFYDFIGQTGNGFTDQKHGWNTQAFQGAEVKRARGGGYFLSLPTPREIG